MERVKYVLSNTTPIQYGDIVETSFETMEHVLPEVLVSKIIAKMFGKTDPALMELFWTHAISIPFIGGLGAPILGTKKHSKMSDGWYDQVYSAAAGVPAVFLAQYILHTFYGANLIRMPKLDMRTIVLVAISKIITRPLVSALTPLLQGTQVQTIYDGLQERLDVQSANSNIRRGAGI